MNRLKASGVKAIGLDLLPGPATQLIADINQKQRLQEAMVHVGAVIHTAAIHGRHYDLNYSREAFIDTNIKGTLNL